MPKYEMVEIDSCKTYVLQRFVQESRLDGRLGTFHTLHRNEFIIKPLETICVNSLLKHVNQQNVFTIFQFCIDCEVDKRLMEKSLMILRSKWSGPKWTLTEYSLKIKTKQNEPQMLNSFIERRLPRNSRNKII